MNGMLSKKGLSIEISQRWLLYICIMMYLKNKTILCYENILLLRVYLAFVISTCGHTGGVYRLLGIRTAIIGDPKRFFFFHRRRKTCMHAWSWFEHVQKRNTNSDISATDMSGNLEEKQKNKNTFDKKRQSYLCSWLSRKEFAYERLIETLRFLQSALTKEKKN